MTRAQQKHVIKLVREWAVRLKLTHVEFSVDWENEPEDEDAMASIQPSDLYDYANLRFRGDFADHDVFTQNRIVVHELVHMMFRDYAAAARSAGIVGMSNDARAMWHDRCLDAEEGLVDRLANRLVEGWGVVT